MSMRYPTVSGEIEFLRDPDLPGLEVRASSYHTVAYPKHTHAGYSVGYVESGASTVFLRGRTDWLEQGEIVLIHPEEVHACNPARDGAWSNRMFYLDGGLIAEAAASVLESVVGELVFARPVVRDARLLAMLRALHKSVRRGDAALAKESLLLDCVARLLERHADPRRGEEAEAAPEPRTVRLAREWLHEHWAEPVRLADLAAATGRSEFAVLRAFKRATGLPPHAYQVQLRMAKARVLLAGGMPIAEVAVETGHTDQSHFTNVFRAQTAATPGQYQRGR